MESDEKSAKCNKCGEKHDLDKYMREGNFFIELSMEAQLRNMMQNDKFSHIVASAPSKTSVCDIYDGQLYKEAVKGSKCHDSVSPLSLTPSCDGSSKRSMWPSLYTLMNLAQQ